MTPQTIVRIELPEAVVALGNVHVWATPGGYCSWHESNKWSMTSSTWALSSSSSSLPPKGLRMKRRFKAFGQIVKKSKAATSDKGEK